MGDTLVSTIRVFICAGACCSALFSASFAAADAVDDLLAGKPVVISPAAPEGAATTPADQSAPERTLKRLIERQTEGDEPLSHESIEVKLTEPSQEGLETAVAGARAPAMTTTSTAKLSLVPEPSAVILAVLSLAYFLIFFRRRYSF